MAAITKMEAVRKALAELGDDAQPVRVQGWVKQKFGLAMSTAHVSNYKTVILRKRSAGSAKAAPVKRSSPGRPPVKPMSKPQGSTVNHAADGASMAKVRVAGIGLNDIETIKSLVIRVGENNLKSLVELLS